jgi:alkylation response protein AidB-like acyl-CoA dehydrogenase
MWPRNEKQASLIDLAKTISKEIEGTAAEHDRNGTFPTEHYDFMRNQGYLRASVPKEQGGEGHGLSDIALAQYEIGKGCGATAVSVGMHLMVIGSEREALAWPEQIRDRIFRNAVKDGAMVNNLASEPDLGSPRGGGRPITILEKTADGKWLLNGRKTFSTLSPVMTYAITLAAVEDGTGDIARVAVRMDSPGVSIDETWDSMSMRASGSHDVIFSDVIVTEEDFVSRSNPSKPLSRSPNGAAWFPLLLSAANLGIAHAARDYAVDFAVNRKPTGSAGTISKIPYIREQVARMESMMLVARRSLFSCAEDWEENPNERKHILPEVSITKVRCIETAIAVTDLAMRIVGGVGLERSRPLERYFRDVRGAIANPPIEARALEQLASHILDGHES